MIAEQGYRINLGQNSQKIGSQHEKEVERLLKDMRLKKGKDFKEQKQFKTKDGIKLLADFWLPKHKPPIIIECKTWGVTARSPASSKRRKLQEALFSLIQFRRFVPQTEDSRMIIVTGKENFDPGEEKFLQTVLGDLHIVNINERGELKKLLS
jgi:predicted acyl esterase